MKVPDKPFNIPVLSSGSLSPRSPRSPRSARSLLEDRVDRVGEDFPTAAAAEAEVDGEPTCSSAPLAPLLLLALPAAALPTVGALLGANITASSDRMS